MKNDHTPKIFLQMIRDAFIIGFLSALGWGMVSCKPKESVIYLQTRAIQIPQTTHQAILVHRAMFDSLEVQTFRDSATGATGTLYAKGEEKNLVIDCPPMVVDCEPEVIHKTVKTVDYKKVFFMSLVFGFVFAMVLNKTILRL